MYPDSPESRDVPAHARTRGPSPVRASVAGGLVGGIGVMLVLMLMGVFAPAGQTRPVDGGETDTVAAATPVPTADSVAGAAATTSETVQRGVAALPPVQAPPATTPPPPAPRPPVRTMEPETPPTATPEQRVRMYRDALQQAILHADGVEIQAMRQLDPSLLASGYTGDQLQKGRDAIETLRGEGLHQDSRLINVQWHSFWVSPDELTARVETTETWYTEYHQNGSDECRAVVPRHDVPQRVTLRRTGRVWKVASVTFTGADPAVQACG